MSKSFFPDKKLVLIDGHEVQPVLDVSFDEDSHDTEEISHIRNNYPITVVYNDRKTGTISLKGMNSSGSNPQNYFDIVSRIFGHSEFNTTTEFIDLKTDTLDAMHQTAMDDYSRPIRKVEFRQILYDTDIEITDDGTDENGFGIRFIAGGEYLTQVILRLRDESGSEVSSFDLEIWEDSVGSPVNQLAGTATHTVTLNPTTAVDYTGSDWETIDVKTTDNIMGTASLTIGETYWLVIRGVSPVNAVLGISIEEDCYTYADSYISTTTDVGSAAWTNSTKNVASFAFMFETVDGHQIDIYIYSTSSRYVHYKFRKVKFFDDSGLTVEPKAVVSQTLHWESLDYDISEV